MDAVLLREAFSAINPYRPASFLRGPANRPSIDDAVTAGKRVYFENIKTEEVLSWIQSVPAIVASASEKYELGKARAIYGTQSIDYFVIGYVISGFEQVMESIHGIQHTNV